MSGDSITQHLSPDAATGIFTVRWKTVSADGHPISGEYVYTVTPAMATEPSTPTTSPTPETSPTEEPEPARPAQTYGGTASGGGAFELLPLFFLSGLALILGSALWSGYGRAPASPARPRTGRQGCRSYGERRRCVIESAGRP
ncbi:copper resistance protein CopC [Microbacterium sp. NRRL B-14842]|uniref:copper resistance protein CopC n=1 Tax=Microbacterium sp. NRRL B-14842 TaxID=3162881 RepID=UPI003D2AB78A